MPESAKPRGPTAGDVVRAVVFWLGTCLSLLFLFTTVDKLVRTGEICSRLGCRYWSQSPGSIAFTVVGILGIVLALGYGALTSSAALWRKRQT